MAGGRAPRDKGYRGEAEWCRLSTEAGVPTERHFMSGMFVKGDCTSNPGKGPLKGQVKRKKKCPDWVELESHDYTAVREDRGEWFVLMRATTFWELCK